MVNYIKIYLLFLVGITLMHLVVPTAIQAKEVPELNPEELIVTFFNLPDGEATLIKINEDQSILLNTGSEKSEESLLSQLEELQISSINTLILTNQTLDYCGNAKRLIERYMIENVAHAGELSKDCKRQISVQNIEQWETSEQKEVSEKLFVKVLHAKKDGEMSLAITYGETSIMYLSNSSVEDESEVLNYPSDPEILKIGDYGKGKSPSSMLLSEIDPHLSIVFNCENCVPDEGLIERLNESWIDVYHLKRVGTTIIRMNLKSYEVIS